MPGKGRPPQAIPSPISRHIITCYVRYQGSKHTVIYILVQTIMSVQAKLEVVRRKHIVHLTGLYNKRVSDMWAPLAACREPAGVQNRQQSVLYVFECRSKNILIHAPNTRIVAFWHINIIPPMVLYSQICYNTPISYMAAIFVKYCYTTGSWLFCL